MQCLTPFPRRFVLRTVCFAIFLALLAIAIVCDDGTPDFSWVEVMLFVFVFGHSLDEAHQWSEAWRIDQNHFGDDGWNGIDALLFWLIFPGVFAMRVYALLVCEPEPVYSLDMSPAGVPLRGSETCLQLEWSRTVLAVANILAFFRFLSIYRVDRDLGVLSKQLSALLHTLPPTPRLVDCTLLVSCTFAAHCPVLLYLAVYMIQSMITDISRFVKVLSIVMFGFAFAFAGLASPHKFELHANAHSPMMLPIWNMFEM